MREEGLNKEDRQIREILRHERFPDRGVPAPMRGANAESNIDCICSSWMPQPVSATSTDTFTLPANMDDAPTSVHVTVICDRTACDRLKCTVRAGCIYAETFLLFGTCLSSMCSDVLARHAYGPECTRPYPLYRAEKAATAGRE